MPIRFGGDTMFFLRKIQDFLSGFNEVTAMSNILPEDSGIKGAVLWINPGTVGGKKLKHGPRLKVTLHGSSTSVSVTITQPARILGKLPKKVEKDVFAFIALNYDLLMDFWNDKMGSKAFLNQIKSI
jgi:hypothetical protein